MTRKDYELIARALIDSKPLFDSYEDRCERHGWRVACHSVCEALASDNSRFDRDRFLKACGVAV